MKSGGITRGNQFDKVFPSSIYLPFLHYYKSVMYTFTWLSHKALKADGKWCSPARQQLFVTAQGRCSQITLKPTTAYCVMILYPTLGPFSPTGTDTGTPGVILLRTQPSGYFYFLWCGFCLIGSPLQRRHMGCQMNAGIYGTLKLTAHRNAGLNQVWK